MIRRIVLTGGPGAGKTVISQQIAQSTPDRYLLVPEAATQVYEQMRTRWDLLDLPGRRDVQRAFINCKPSRKAAWLLSIQPKHSCWIEELLTEPPIGPKARLNIGAIWAQPSIWNWLATTP